MMPERDGWQVLSDLKNNPETRKIPVVMCTILDDGEKGFNLGAAEYLVKPFLQEDLVHTINRIANNMDVKKILVVDDDADDLRLVEKMLSNNGNFQIILCEGGIKGWQKVQDEKPDIVITDLFMPDLDGFTLLGKIRRDPTFMNMPVIVLSGRDLTSGHHTRLAEFGQRFLEKGKLSEKDLVGTLNTLLRTIKK
jgi:CheY-like chemotaxis protein